MEKMKSKARFNIVDGLVLLAVLIALGAVSYKLFHQQVSNIVAPKVKMTVVAKVRGAQDYHFTAANQQLPAQLVAGNALIPDAYIVAVKKEPYVIQNNTADGRVVDAVDPTKFDLVFTIEAIIPKDAAVYKIGPQEIRVGKGYIVKTNVFEVNANIYEMSYVDVT